jgi:hypothetical protein
MGGTGKKGGETHSLSSTNGQGSAVQGCHDTVVPTQALGSTDRKDSDKPVSASRPEAAKLQAIDSVADTMGVLLGGLTSGHPL